MLFRSNFFFTDLARENSISFFREISGARERHKLDYSEKRADSCSQMKPSCKFIFASHSGTTLGTKFCGHSNEVQMHGIWKKMCGRYRWPLWGWGWGLGSSTVFNLHLLYTIQLFLCLICLYTCSISHDSCLSV